MSFFEEWSENGNEKKSLKHIKSDPIKSYEPVKSLPKKRGKNEKKKKHSGYETKSKVSSSSGSITRKVRIKSNINSNKRQKRKRRVSSSTRSKVTKTTTDSGKRRKIPVMKSKTEKKLKKSPQKEGKGDKLSDSDEKESRDLKSIVSNLLNDVVFLKNSTQQENEELKEVIFQLRDQVDILQKTITGMKSTHEKRIGEMRSEYLQNFHRYHQSEYFITEMSITPTQTLKKSEEDDKFSSYYCFENETLRYKFSFFVASGTNEECTISFEELRIHHNNQEVENFSTPQNSVEFEVKYTKIGENKLTLNFHNVHKEYCIIVEPSSLSVSKSQLNLFRGEIEPSGEVTQFEEQSTGSFSSDDIIQVVISFYNENGFPLGYDQVKEYEFTSKLFRSGERKYLKGILSRYATISIGENDVNEKGEFVVCTIGEKEKLEPGKYVVSVLDVEFSKSKDLVIL